MDDVDDILGDLLSEGPSKKPEVRKDKISHKAVTSSRKASEDDAFYNKLAAQADEGSLSDVSDADPSKMVADFDPDDLDAALFGKKGASNTKSVPAKGPNSSNKMRTKQDDFDLDDPLAGLLSDEEDSTPRKPKSALKKMPEPKASLRTETTDKSIARPADVSQGSRRLEVDRPPTRSGTGSSASSGRHGRRRDDDVMFDDEDVLGGMGLDSPRHTVAKKPHSAPSEEHRPGGAKSILDDLLGGSDTKSELQRPGTGDNAKKEFSLDRKYQTRSAEERRRPAPESDDFGFGSYMPSAAASSGSRPSSRRSVRFEDENDGDERPASQGSTRRTKASALEDMITKDDRGWLDMASNEVGKDNRPPSTDSIKDKPSRPGTSDSTNSEPVDWLGISRIGSPDSSPRRHVENTDPVSPARSKPSQSKTKKVESGDDWLGISNDNANSKKDTAGLADDWLGIGESNNTESAGVDDWLGYAKSDSGSKEKAEDQIGSGGSTSKKNQVTREDDWLGTSGQIEAEVIPSPFDSPTKRADELFSVPPSHQPSSGLSWEEDNRRGRRRQPKSSQASGDGGYSLADSPRGLASTLDALIDASKPSVDTTPQSSQQTTHIHPVSHATQRSDPAVISNTPAETINPGVPVSTGSFLPISSSTPVMIPAQPAMSTVINQQDLVMQQQQLALQQQASFDAQMKQQQHQLVEQQQKQQEHLRQQQQQQMLQVQQQLHEQQQQQMILSMQQPLPSMSAGTYNIGLGISETPDIKARRLEQENNHLLLLLDSRQRQHNEEMKVVEVSHKKRVELIEESCTKREKRLKEENEVLAEESRERQKLLEEERQKAIALTSAHHAEWEREKKTEVDRIKDEYRLSIKELHEQQAEALERLKLAKEKEMEAITVTQSHSRSLQAVIERIDTNAHDLQSLHTIVQSKHSTSLDDRETAAKTRDQQLTTMQDRLERQQHETEQERARLQGLVTRLEKQLTDQARSLEQEKWSLRQQESAVRLKETSLEEERKMLLEQIERQKLEVDRSKDDVLSEQKMILSQLNEERRALAEERAQFTVSHKLKIEQEQRDSLRSVKVEAELTSGLKAISSERAQLDRDQRILSESTEKTKVDQARLEQEREALASEKRRLEQVAIQMRQRSQDVQELSETAMSLREQGELALLAAKQTESEHVHRARQAQQEMDALRGKERQIAQERLSLAKEKAALDKARGSAICLSCRTPVKDVGGTMVSAEAARIPATVNGSADGPPRMTPAAEQLYNKLSPHLDNGGLHKIATEIQQDRSVRVWRIHANEDQAFLKDESMFLEALKHTSYPASSST